MVRQVLLILGVILGVFAISTGIYSYLHSNQYLISNGDIGDRLEAARSLIKNDQWSEKIIVLEVFLLHGNNDEKIFAARQLLNNSSYSEQTDVLEVLLNLGTSNERLDAARNLLNEHGRNKEKAVLDELLLNGHKRERSEAALCFLKNDCDPYTMGNAINVLKDSPDNAMIAEIASLYSQISTNQNLTRILGKLLLEQGSEKVLSSIKNHKDYFDRFRIASLFFLPPEKRKLISNAKDFTFKVTYKGPEELRNQVLRHVELDTSSFGKIKSLDFNNKYDNNEGSVLSLDISLSIKPRAYSYPGTMKGYKPIEGPQYTASTCSYEVKLAYGDEIVLQRSEEYAS